MSVPSCSQCDTDLICPKCQSVEAIGAKIEEVKPADRDPAIEETKEVMTKLMNQLAKKGFMLVALVGYREGVSDNETVRVGCFVDFYKHPKMKPVVIRMLKNTATILEADEETRVIETLDVEGGTETE